MTAVGILFGAYLGIRIPFPSGFATTPPAANTPNLDEYDRAMVTDRRAAILVTASRFSSNPPE